MGLSAIGSAGAWFAGYLRKEERSTHSSLRERLLDMLAAARRDDRGCDWFRATLENAGWAVVLERRNGGCVVPA
jgi:hypothetical protein